MPDPIAIALEVAPEHQLPGHPETPDRFAQLPSLFDLAIGERLERVAVEPIRIEQLEQVHPDHYVRQIQAAAASAPAFLDGGDTYVCPDSFQAALRAAGAALAVSEVVLSGGYACGFSLARPPGHHASADRALGFCLLNNVAIAGHAALSAGVERLLIVDFDVHHGNGTQDLFEAEPRVAYISLHQRGIFPGTGHFHERGVGPGNGTILNVPLPGGTGHAAYIDLFRKIVHGAVSNFQPELLMVSAGYDAHWRDPLANLRLTAASYYEIGRILAEAATAAGCQLVYILEGGYDAEVLSVSVHSTLAGTLSLPQPADPIGSPSGADHEQGDLWETMQGHPLL